MGNDPQPPKANHFSNVFVFHRASKCVHNDDTFMFVEDLKRFGKLVGGLLWLERFKKNTLILHPSYKKALVDPAAFVSWIKCLLDKWDFEHLCTAHNGNCFGVAKQQIRELMEKKDKELTTLAVRRAEGKLDVNTKWSDGAWGEDSKGGCECG